MMRVMEQPVAHAPTTALECDCQMVVLLVYAPVGAPVSLVIHGNDGQSWLSLVDRPDQRADPATMLAIQMALRTDTISNGPMPPHRMSRAAGSGSLK